MKSFNKYQILNIVLFIFAVLMVCFELSKNIYYASVRPLSSADYRDIASLVEHLLLYCSLFIFWTIYNKTGKCRKLSFAFLLICVIVSFIKVYSETNTFLVLFFPTEIYNPVFIDKFTSLFELCYTSIFALSLLVSLFVLVKKKYFKKII